MSMFEYDYGQLIGYCDVCESPMYENSAHCINCGNVPCYLICETCWGTGEIQATEKVHSQSIDIPWKVCPDCGGSRRKEEFSSKI